MKTLIEQLEEFLDNHPNKDECISAEKFKEMFLLGFANQLQLNLEECFDFNVEDTGNGNCNIVAKLKQSVETTCHILNEFFLEKNLSVVEDMFGVPQNAYIEDIGDGLVEIK